MVLPVPSPPNLVGIAAGNDVHFKNCFSYLIWSYSIHEYNTLIPRGINEYYWLTVLDDLRACTSAGSCKICCIGYVDKLSRVKLLTWFYCWSQPEGEFRNAHCLFRMSAPRFRRIRCLSFWKQLGKYAVKSLPGSNWEVGFFLFPLS